MKRFGVFLFVFSMGNLASAWAFDAVEIFNVNTIDVSQGEITLFAEESTILGLSCTSGSKGKLSGLNTIKIGDIIKYEKYSFRVGIIEVSKVNDYLNAKENVVQNSEVTCVVAENESALPYDEDCDALWLRIVNCRPSQ